MKTCMLFWALIFTHTIYAQSTITVSGNPKIPAQYEDLFEAISEAVAGDTLLIHPAESYYDPGPDSLVIDKPLVLIGGGFYNDSLEYGGNETLINKLVLRGEADESVVANMSIERLVIMPDAPTQTTYNQVTIRNNYINRIDFYSLDKQFDATAFGIRQNIIRLIFFNDWDSLETGTNPEIAIENNVIGQIANGGSENLLIRNNVFTPLFGGSALFEISGATIVNNIFYSREETKGIGTKECEFCIFDYNLSYRTHDQFVGGTDNVFGAHNIENTNPLWTRIVSHLAGLKFIMRADLTLQDGSPAQNAGSEGTNIGITGGAFPFNPNVRFGYPHVRSIQMNNPVLGVDDILKFTIQGVFPR